MLNIDDRLLDDLNESELFLMLHVAKRMKANRMTAWPSVETLCKDCKWDERTVKKWRLSLINRGYLEMKLNPGKPTIYRFKKSGIGVYQSLNNDEGYTEQGANKEGTKNVPPAIYEGTQNAVERGQKMYPEVINKEVINKKDNNTPAVVARESENFTGSETDADFEMVGEIETGAKILDFNDFQKTKTASPAADFQPANYSSTAGPRVDIAEECAAILLDPMLREQFTMGRKVPADRYEAYVRQFQAEKTALKETYWSVPKMRAHFLNWSESHYRIECNPKKNTYGSSKTTTPARPTREERWARAVEIGQKLAAERQAARAESERRY